MVRATSRVISRRWSSEAPSGSSVAATDAVLRTDCGVVSDGTSAEIVTVWLFAPPGSMSAN